MQLSSNKETIISCLLTLSPTDLSNQNKLHHEDEDCYAEYSKLIQTLPSRQGLGPMKLIKYGNFWYPSAFLITTMAFYDSFQPQPTDIFLATYPKSGTTWIKAIVFAIVNGTRFAFDNNHPLLAHNPHVLVPFLEHMCNKDNIVRGQLKELSQPRVLSMHTPYSALPSSLTNSNRPIDLYRNPKDTLVSLWHFMHKIMKEAVVPFDEAFEMFCEGCSGYGPKWDHMLEYWRESVRQPDKILFLKYEELKAEQVKNVKKLAEFVGYPFSQDEVKEGVVEEIVNLCSFEKLSNAEVNKNGLHVVDVGHTLKSSIFFRKGNIGDWKEHLTSEMAQKLDKIIQERLEGSGLTFCS